jgi:transposase
MDDKDIIIAQLQALVRQLTERIKQLEDEVARLKKNSSNSSKPPSSDIVKPALPKPRRGIKLKRGGQNGHRKHLRPAFTPEQVDKVVLYDLPAAKVRELEPLADYRVIQQVELAARPFVVTEHRARRYRCRRTGRVITAPMPPGVVRAGLLGPRLSALVAYQKGACHMSYTTIRSFLRDVLGIPVSTGQLAKVVAKASASLETAYDQLAEALRSEKVLGVDETGHNDSGTLHWSWCLRAEDFTWYRIDRSRSSRVLRDVLGERFAGVIGCDYFSAYRKYKRESATVVQFCLAHLIREIRFLAEKPDKVLKTWAGKLLDQLKKLFRTLHSASTLGPQRWAAKMDAIRREYLRIVRRPPQRSEAHTLSKRFVEHGESYFTFLRHAGVEPTNNLTEQAIRHLVIDRKVTQGTRGTTGQRWCQRIWSVLATCAQQGRSAYDFIAESMQTYLKGTPQPSLLTGNL